MQRSRPRAPRPIAWKSLRKAPAARKQSLVLVKLALKRLSTNAIDRLSRPHHKKRRPCGAVFYGGASERLRVGIAALKRLFECSLATANCASKSLFALHCSSSLALDLWEAGIAKAGARFASCVFRGVE